MIRYEVILSPRAYRQLGDPEQWIESEAGAAIARDYRESIIAHCFQLETFPDRGRSRDDLRPGVQTMVHRRRVTLVYQVSDDIVVIVAIVGRGRDIAAALHE